MKNLKSLLAWTISGLALTAVQSPAQSTCEPYTFNTLADSFNTPYAGRLGPRSDCRFAALPYFRGIATEGDCRIL